MPLLPRISDDEWSKWQLDGSFIWLFDCCSFQPQHCNHQVMIPKITNIGHLPVTYIFKATSKSPRDSHVIDLVSLSARRVLPGHFIMRTVLECCSANNQMMGAAEIHKNPPLSFLAPTPCLSTTYSTAELPTPKWIFGKNRVRATMWLKLKKEFSTKFSKVNRKKKLIFHDLLIIT